MRAWGVRKLGVLQRFQLGVLYIDGWVSGNSPFLRPLVSERTGSSETTKGV